jgi:hypothetical protein
MCLGSENADFEFVEERKDIDGHSSFCLHSEEGRADTRRKAAAAGSQHTVAMRKRWAPAYLRVIIVFAPS